MPEVKKLHTAWMPHAGGLLSFLPMRIHQDGTSRWSVFSAAVVGLGDRHGSNKWAMSRMEWLALEFVVACIEQLQEVQTTYSGVPVALQDAWGAIELITQQDRSSLVLDILISPHKMEFNGLEFDGSGAGAHDRADILLVAVNSTTYRSYVIFSTYHSTNWPKHTFRVPDAGMFHEGRILCDAPARCHLFLHNVAAAIHKGVFGIGAHMFDTLEPNDPELPLAHE